MEAEQATDHLNYVLTYLPEKFFKQDHNCVRGILVLKRFSSFFFYFLEIFREC